MNNYINKKIAIWGVGFFQVDIEAMYNIKKVDLYIDDDFESKDVINITKDDIKPSTYLTEMKFDSSILFIICTKDKERAVRILNDLGYCRENYLLVEELLTNKQLYNNFHKFDITIYGIGKTYLFWKKDLNVFDLNIARFAVTENNVEKFDGKDVISIDALKELKGKTRIVVCSIYYKEIFYILKEAGFNPGYDFIQLDTFMALNNLVHNVNSNYKFVDRSNGYNNLLVVLSGYKDFVWDSVFGRLKKYLPEKMDVCIVTSGKENCVMENMCNRNQWSYLSTEINNVSLAINLAVNLHKSARYIFKMDEDIFITKGTFEKLLETYEEVESKSDYEVGFVSPIIPVNGYGYARILDLLNLRSSWEDKFGEIKITDCYKHHMAIHDNPDAAKFLWGKDNPSMIDIDSLQNDLCSRKLSYSICPIRYSIGLILFDRDNWLRMGMFPVNTTENMGADEKHICKFCLMHGRAMVISENCIVGHLSYGPQHEAMETYYNKNKFIFEVK